jgi:hypothetical protein
MRPSSVRAAARQSSRSGSSRGSVIRGCGSRPGRGQPSVAADYRREHRAEGFGAANGTATLDAIRGESIAAVDVASDQAPGDLHGTLSVVLSDLRGNAARALNNSLNYTVLQLLNL